MLRKATASALLLCSWLPALAQGVTALDGAVTGVVDGDTLDVSTGVAVHRIRLASVDAPERSQAYGHRAKAALSEMVYGRRVTLRCFGQERRPSGQRSRQICTVFRDGADINLALVASGWAWHYKAFASQQSPADRISYDQAEQRARAGRLGLWAESEPVAPWAFRRQKRASAAGKLARSPLFVVVPVTGAVVVPWTLGSEFRRLTALRQDITSPQAEGA